MLVMTDDDDDDSDDDDGDRQRPLSPRQRILQARDVKGGSKRKRSGAPAWCAIMPAIGAASHTSIPKYNGHHRKSHPSLSRQVDVNNRNCSTASAFFSAAETLLASSSPRIHGH